MEALATKAQGQGVPSQGVIVETPPVVAEKVVERTHISPSEGEFVHEEKSADEVLGVVKDHGIDEGFEYVANGFKNTTNTEEGEKLVKEEKETVKAEDGKTPQEIEFEKEVVVLQERIAELTEGQEGIKKEMADITRQLFQTSEISRATVLVLHALVEKLYEEEEDKKKKESLWMLLTKLAGFLATSLLAGPEEGEKILKNNPKVN